MINDAPFKYRKKDLPTVYINEIKKAVLTNVPAKIQNAMSLELVNDRQKIMKAGISQDGMRGTGAILESAFKYSCLLHGYQDS